VLPEQRLFAVNRHATGEERKRVIRRGFLNGMGWVVWQDVFGLALPYTPGEAALLKKCRTIFRENLSALNSPKPTPCVETGAEGVYANEFPVDEKRMWTFYNAREQEFRGEIPAVRPREGFHLVDAWNRREAWVTEDGCLWLEIEPGEVGCVVEFPRLIEMYQAGDAVGVNRAVEGGRLVVRVDGLEREMTANPDERLELARAARQGEARLMRGNEMVDWVFFPWGGAA
jgi:hypothetical protein